MPNQTGKAWYLNTQYGITTYDDKTIADFVIAVRTATVKSDTIKIAINEIPFVINPIITMSDEGIAISIQNTEKQFPISINIYNALGELVKAQEFIEPQNKILLPNNFKKECFIVLQLQIVNKIFRYKLVAN